MLPYIAYMDPMGYDLTYLKYGLKKKRRVTSNQPGPPFDRRLSLASPQRCYRSCRRDCLTRADPLPERRNGSVTIHGRKFTEDSWNMVDDIYAVDMVYIYGI